jgi:hypothetical protein
LHTKSITIKGISISIAIPFIVYGASAFSADAFSADAFSADNKNGQDFFKM